MTAISELEGSIARFLAVADEAYWDKDSDIVASAAYHLVSVIYVIDRLREEGALDDRLDAYSWMIQHSARTVWQRLPEFEAGTAELEDVAAAVAQAKVHARSLRDTSVELRGGNPCLGEAEVLLHGAWSVAPGIEADSGTPAARPATASPTARRAILLAVLVLPAAHRSRFREEWTAMVLDRPRLHQLRYAVSFLIGAYATRRALLEADARDSAIPATDPP